MHPPCRGLCGNDLRLREVFKNDFPRDGRAMWQHLVQQCCIQVDDLRLLQHDADFDNATILNTVGYVLDSVVLFQRFLNGLNAKRPASKHTLRTSGP